MKLKKVLTLLLAVGITLSTGGLVEAGIDYELRNSDAFSGKNSYHKNGIYNNNASYATHRTAFSNAISKINAVANADIKLSSGSLSSAHIKMVSVNSASYDWYGQASWNSTSATLKINESTCKRDGFAQSNYNKTALHELGHAFYMRHQYKEVNSVMKQGKYSYSDYPLLDKSNFAYQY